MRYDVGRFRRPMRRSTEGQLMSLISLGDGSTLTLDFTTGQLDPRLTFTRASTGTFINASGNVATASNNVARFDHDPTTLAPKGLLIEGAATNLCTYSQDFSNAAWVLDNGSAVNPSVSSVSQSAPDGSATVNRITFNKTGGTFSRIRNTITGTSGATYTFSVWMKANTANGGAATQNVGLRIGADNSGFNCVVTTTWQRFRYSFTLTTTDAAAQIMLWDNTIGNDETADVLVWGAQLEAGSGASSYIPTGASTVQRLADNCYIYDTTTTGGLSWFKTATQGTFYVEMFKRSAGTAFAAAGYGTRGTATQDFMLYQAVGNNWLSFNWGAGENIVNYTALSSPFLIKSAAALSPRVGTPTTADVLQSINGTAGTLNTSPNVTLPFTSDLFCIGSRGAAAGTAPSQNYAETAIRRIKFFPFAMTAAQMNAMTTL